VVLQAQQPIANVTPQTLNWRQTGKADVIIAFNMMRSPEAIQQKLVNAGLTAKQAIERMRAQNIQLP